LNSVTRAWRRLKTLAGRRIYGWAEYYRRHGAKIGYCPVFANPVLAEPHLCEIGDNCWLTVGVVLQNHDGGIAMLHRAGRTDAVNVVGKIVIRDNVFVGTRSVIMGDVEIGPNAIVAAGSIVTKDVPPETVVGGVPAKPICTIDEYLARYTSEEATLWCPGEGRITSTVIEHFMKNGQRGKKALRLRSGKSNLTA
jgi:acetyltransferase-like isoleucine patch superfamily enzyme